VLPDLGLEHRLHRDGSLGCPGDLHLQLYVQGNGVGLSAKKNKPKKGWKPAELTPGLLLPASGLDPRGLGFLSLESGLDLGSLGLFLQALGLNSRSLGRLGSLSPQLCITPGS